MLDDLNVLKQRDPHGALAIAAGQYKQAGWDAEVKSADSDGRTIKDVIVAGMGGSALAAEIVKTWLAPKLNISFEIVKAYDLPAYDHRNALVIASSYSGNTEETISCLEQAIKKDAQVAVIASGGKLIEMAKKGDMAHVVLPANFQPRMAMLYNLRALLALLVNFGVIGKSYLDEVADCEKWLHEQSDAWTKEVPVDKNYAKQLALLAVGKTPIFYAGNLMAPIAYKWKISWNENAKNVAFWNSLPEFNHNEFIGWASHPVEKPFAVFDLVSNFEHERVLKRFEITDRLLSGKRPKANRVALQGPSPIAQMLWGCILADFASIYVAILNGVDPVPVDLVEKLKKELAG